MEAWILAVGVVLAIAAEGLVFGAIADLVLKHWHPERPGDVLD